jgi:hypothetical protein
LTALLLGVVTLEVVIVLLIDGDFTVNGELSSGNLASLGLSLSLGNGFVNLSLVSDNVLVWDG